jgi:hypothetical protein
MVTTNSTLPIINIPATLTPILGSSSGGNDPATLVTSIGAIATSIFSLYKNHTDDKKQDERTDKISTAQLQTVDSLKATDNASAQDSSLAYLVINALSKHPEMQKILDDPSYGENGKSILSLATDYKQGWDEAMKAYYKSKPRIPGEFSKDPVIQKVTEVLTQTAPTPAP